MIIKFDPKEDFKALPEAKVYRDFAASPIFNRAVTAALLRYGDNLTASGTDDSDTKFHKLMGAREIIGVLLNLTEEPDLPKTAVLKQLNPRA